MPRRFLILPVVAVVIAGLVAYRLQREASRPPAALFEPPPARTLAPAFELYDQNRQLVVFRRFLGRTRIVVVFYDRDPGAADDPLLTQLRTHLDKVESAGVQVVGISTATPLENQQSAERAGVTFAFPLLSDITQNTPLPLVHQQFGRYDDASQQTRTGVFLIDRAGMIAWDGSQPLAVSNPRETVDGLCRGEWPRGLR